MDRQTPETDRLAPSNRPRPEEEDGFCPGLPLPQVLVSEPEGLVLALNRFFRAAFPDLVPAVVGRSLADYFQGPLPGFQPSGPSEPPFRRLTRNGSVYALIPGRARFRGRPAGLAVFLDMTESARQRDQLREAAWAAEDLSKMKSAFLAHVGHELRTPLHGLAGLVELALDSPGLPGRVEGYLNRIRESAEALTDLVNEVLDISVLETGTLIPARKPFYLAEVFRDLTALIGPKAAAKDLLFHVRGRPYPGALMGDAPKLKRCLANLLSNAVKFTNAGLVQLASQARETGDGRVEVRFDIRDTGVGLTAWQARRVFEPFSPTEQGSTRKYSGLGLGLAIAQKLVGLMGGELTVESEVGAGSDFAFTLTFDQAAADSGPRLRSAERPERGGREEAAREGGPQALEVLVFEDNALNRQVIVEQLAKLGLKVAVAADGAEGLEMVKARLNGGARLFDLIFMDIRMPVMDGVEAVGRLREMGVATPIVALTANRDLLTDDLFGAEGFSGALAKPFTAAQLRACLGCHLPAAPGLAGGAPEEAEPDPGEAAASPAVLDAALGLARAAGDPALQKRLRMNFLKDNRNFYEDFAATLRAGDRRSALRLIHTLSGTASLIGAGRLAGLAGELECALAGSETPEIPLDRLGAALAEVLAELDRTAGAPEADPEPEPGPADGPRALALLATLEPLLREGALKALDLLDELPPVLGRCGGLGEKLREQIAGYDFDLAQETLEELKLKLGGDGLWTREEAAS